MSIAQVATSRDAEAGREAGTPSVRGALAALSLAMLLSSLGTSIANVALPALAEDLAAPFARVQWVVLAFLLAVTALVVGAGRLGDLVGRRRLLAAGIAVFTLASALCAAAPTLGTLIAARAAQGLGAAVMMALTLAFVGQAVPKERTGRVMGLLGTMSAVGTALGPSLGGVLVAAAGWRAVFLVQVPLGAAALLLARRHLPADRPGPGEARGRFDAAGTLLLAAALAAYALAMTRGGGETGALLVAAAAGAALFAWRQARAPSPLVRLEMLREPALRAGLATGALVSTVMMATLVVGPFFLSRALGLAPAAVGLAMAVGPGVTALAGVPAGRLVDRFGAHRTGVAGLAVLAAGAVVLAALPVGGVARYVVPLAVMTAGYALFQTANNTGVMGEVAPDRRGVASGLLGLARNLGLVTGASLMGAVFARASGAADVATAPPAAVAAGMRTTFAVAAALVVLALAVAVAGRARAPRAGGAA